LALMQHLFYSTSPVAHQLGAILAAVRVRQGSCRNRAKRVSAATPRDPFRRPS
jgi:hypothetical protein